jgi:FixJ family two-component response regulator
MARFPAGSVASFLQKPYRVEELRHCLEAALASAERRRPHLARR